jgi:hypothetical protein
MKPAIITAVMKFSSRNDGKEPHYVVTVKSFSYLSTIRGDPFHCYACKMTFQNDKDLHDPRCWNTI